MIGVSVTVVTEDPEMAVKATEVLSRALVGLGLEGIMGQLTVGPTETEESAEEEQSND